MKSGVVLLWSLLATNATAATAYVTDELVLGVYGEQKTQGQRLATLHSGAAVDTLSTAGDSTQVRIAGGIVGWVKSIYLIKNKPATVRLKELQDELDRTRATTPALAEAAEHSEVDRLTRELAEAQSGLRSEPRALPPPATIDSRSVALWLAALLSALGIGFWLGYAALARRIKMKFGGIKVY